MNTEELELVAIRIYGEKSDQVKGLLELIKSMYRLIEQGVIRNDFRLSDVEVLSIVMLEGFDYDIIQKPAFNENLLDDFNEILINSLDCALLKIPKTNYNTLYRQDKYYCKIPEAGEILVFKGFLTASKDDYDNTHNIKWIITPLSNGLTKAHDIYRVYNHGYNCPYPEWQVQFERNTSFIVTQVETKKNHTEVYITEQ